MEVKHIELLRDKIVLKGELEGEVVVRESAPTVGSKPGRTLSISFASAKGGEIELSRFEGERDRFLSRFDLFKGGDEIGGVRFVDKIAPDVSKNNSPYPQPESIKMLGLPPKMAEQYGIKQSLININLPALMTAEPSDKALIYRFNGRDYYFIKSAVEALDRQLSQMTATTMILLNSPRLFGSTGEKALLEGCIHPRYDWDSPTAFISAFDMETEEGQGYYAAFVSFLTERYCRADKKYGNVVGAIISNEISSQYIWGNAGEMTGEEYMREYSTALRVAYLCGRKYCSHFRVYISLDQFFCGQTYDMAKPLRFYSGRHLLELLGDICQKEGNFPWNVAYHPYPEDLRWPDFWHDRAPDFTFSTPKITFKNMEVLEAFLSQDKFLYEGAPRRIIFSEQGFNSQSGELQDLTEQMAAAGYVLAYLKARNMKTVDMFTHHACVDNPQEFGLNLGMFRYDPTKEDNMGQPKPIFASFEAMDGENEAEAVKKAREFIGTDLFDYLLNPPIQKSDRDTSQDDAFGA